jgi:pyruvate dehydrogenase E2 component (dihydrolipoamide acetyltransferase)
MGVFTMPSLGADMEAGKLVEWLVEPGDTVRSGDVVAVVETQKGAIEIEIFQSGIVDRLEAEVGATLPVGAPLAWLRAPGEEPSETPAAATPTPGPSTEPVAKQAGPVPEPPERRPIPQPAPAPPAPERTAAVKPARAPGASPAARARAAELGLDLAAIAGSGPGGAVLLADVETAAGSAPAQASQPPAPSSRGPARSGLDITAMRQAIAAAMARSKREIPHYYLAQTIDLQPAADWLAAANAERTPERRLLMGALLLRATARAARAVPEMNGHYVDDTFRPSEAVHAGLAISLRGGGLVTPAIRDTDLLDLDALMAAMRDLVERARIGRLRSSEVSDGTITLTSMGETGADTLTGVIYPPQVAIVGFGAPVVRPWVIGAEIVPRRLVTVTLAADHRVSDGRRGAKFLAEIARLLGEPETP